MPYKEGQESLETGPRPGDEKSEFSGKWSTGGGLAFTKKDAAKLEGKGREEDVIAGAKQEVIDEMVADLLKSNPKADVESAKKRFAKTLNQKIDLKGENESAILLHESGIEIEEREILILQEKLKIAENQKEKDEILNKIRSHREGIRIHKKEIRAVINPGSEKAEGGMSDEEFEEAKAHAKK